AQSQNLDRNKDLTEANELTSQLVKLSKEGRYKEALPLAQKVVEIRQQLLSPDDTSLGSAFGNLGELYFANKKDSEAEKALQRALAIYEQHIERTSLEISKVLDRLAHIRFHNNDYDGADALFMRSLTIKERELGPTNPSTIEAMKDYACLDLIARNSKGGLLQTEQDEAKRRLRARAWCWLDGLSDDCANQGSRGVKPQGVVNGRAVRLVTPKYPYVFGQKRFAGKVFVSVLIDEAGNV